jgi:hypothetical protein
MRIVAATLMAGLLLTLPASSQCRRGWQAAQGSNLASGKGMGPKGGRTCDGTGPKRQGKGGSGGCARGQAGRH